MYGCKSGLGFAPQDLANQQGVRVFGQTGFASFSYDRYKKIKIKDMAKEDKKVYLMNYDYYGRVEYMKMYTPGR